MKFKTTKAVPIAMRKTVAFVNFAGGRGGLQAMEVPEYEPSKNSEMLSVLRKVRGITFGDAADVFECPASTVSYIERSQLLVDDDNYVIAAGLLLTIGKDPK